MLYTNQYKILYQSFKRTNQRKWYFIYLVLRMVLYIRTYVTCIENFCFQRGNTIIFIFQHLIHSLACFSQCSSIVVQTPFVGQPAEALFTPRVAVSPSVVSRSARQDTRKNPFSIIKKQNIFYCTASLC